MAEFDGRYATAQPGAASEAASYDAGLRAYMLSVYNYMAAGVALTGVAAYGLYALAASNEAVAMAVFGSPLKWVILLAPLAMVFFLSFRINAMSVGAAQMSFWIYAALVGLSLAGIFIAFTGQSIAQVFFITAATFGATSLYGYTTKRDLLSMGSFLFMGLVGIIIASLVNIFLQSSMLHWVTSVLGVLIFVGFTAYDTQKLKSIYMTVAGDGTAVAKSAIMGALNLYLDFLNLFIFLLQLIGDRR